LPAGARPGSAGRRSAFRPPNRSGHPTGTAWPSSRQTCPGATIKPAPPRSGSTPLTAPRSPSSSRQATWPGPTGAPRRRAALHRSADALDLLDAIFVDPSRHRHLNDVAHRVIEEGPPNWRLGRDLAHAALARPDQRVGEHVVLVEVT